MSATPRAYNYKKPRSINPVSILMLLLVVGGVYASLRFGPVYWNRWKVDQILAEGAVQATNIATLNPTAQRSRDEQIVAEVVARIGERGITTDALDADGNELTVYFDEDYAKLVADWTVVVKHPVGKPTTLHFHRSADVK